MANKKISELTELTAGNTAPTTDFLAIVDTSATETKKVTPDAVVADFLAQTTSKTISGPTAISVNSASDALRITQTGAGNCLVVEDSANPDETPFVIDANGRLILGHTASLTIGGAAPAFQNYAVSGFQTSMRASADASGVGIRYTKSRGTSPTSVDIVASGDRIADILFSATDGVTHITAAAIAVTVDGTPGLNDMPGRITFHTTADGASSVTERMRIDSAGSVGIGASIVAGRTLIVGKSITGSINAMGIRSDGTVMSDVTSSARGFSSALNTDAIAFTLSNLQHYRVDQGTIGAGSAVTNQFGFYVESSLISATNNYAFFANLASGTGRWNFYAAGTARNYFAGGVEVLAGTTTQAVGFLNCSAAAGVPTGVPTNPTGNVPIYYDTTNNKLYVYNGAWRSTAALT